MSALGAGTRFRFPIWVMCRINVCFKIFVIVIPKEKMMECGTATILLVWIDQMIYSTLTARAPGKVAGPAQTPHKRMRVKAGFYGTKLIWVPMQRRSSILILRDSSDCNSFQTNYFPILQQIENGSVCVQQISIRLRLCSWLFFKKASSCKGLWNLERIWCKYTILLHSNIMSISHTSVFEACTGMS